MTIGNGINFDDSGGPTSPTSIGLVDLTPAAEVNRSLNQSGRNSQGVSRQQGRIQSARGYGVVETADPNEAAELLDRDSDGFDAYTRDLNAACSVGFLALAFGGAAQFAVAGVNSHTSTGSQSFTGVGFKPQFMLWLLSNADADDDKITNNEKAGTTGIAVHDADNQYCMTVYDETSQSTMDTSSLSDDQAFNTFLDDGTTAYHNATFTSFDADGVTYNYSTANGTARRWTYLAVEEVLEVDQPEVTMLLPTRIAP